MEAKPVKSGPATLLSNLLFFALLFILALLFFHLVRNNTFWHAGDYLYLSQALKIERSWTEIFASAPYQVFQPLVNAIFYLEFKCFGLNPWHYYLFNIFIHSVNALLVYMVVWTLLRSRTISVLSSLLFVFAVGNYGKAVMVVTGISDLLITMLTLLTLLLYFKNELEKGGKLSSRWFLGSLGCFLLSLLTKATSFSILGCMIVFNLFFKAETGKRVFHKNFLVIAVAALVVLVTKLIFLPYLPGKSDFIFIGFYFFKNFGSYLIRMVFPIHYSSTVATAGPVVQFIYTLATEIRVFTFLCILSYSVFGFIFGNRAIRFFIAWTYITVTPFCFFKFPMDWLNIRYLYLVSIGFSMLLASGTVLASDLLQQRRWRRFLPYSVPLIFILLSQFITYHLDRHYEAIAASPEITSTRDDFLVEYRNQYFEEERR
ncbi:MAG: hypothetical protein GTO51_03110 [Candidatus Latescibacteria bacterium]|nr:hypothetical protein [Candidatus Latescibacterota bacterium]NIM22674.1 hypothetical protein [Candidatus Latescibacterota bacterium]NIM64963.1 hypothetical protein [Candidatus Latescibacterota bacterium]NIO01478.1 hypothetical protein [Candidatus Latescibacterota bacterium]NIO27988.1 hypothetical protein [Candidatus Latescibacterota bacterium]